MPRETTIFVSDIHMGASPDYDWLGKNCRAELASFFAGLAKNESVGEVVLAGDTLDNWVFPSLTKAPPTFIDILGASPNDSVVQAIKAVVKAGIKVIYVQGNHDMDAWGDLPGALSQKLPGVIYEPSGVDRDPLWAEHGSMHAMFTAPDPLHDPDHHLPLGYFITRVNESHPDTRGYPIVGSVVRDAVLDHAVRRSPAMVMPRRLSSLGAKQIDAVSKNFIAERLAEWVFDAVMTKAGVAPSQEVTLPGGQTITLADVRHRYADLYADWVQAEGADAAWRALIAEIDVMGPAAHEVSKKLGKKAVLFGHSHNAFCSVLDSKYLNDGCFLRNTKFLKWKSPHWIEATPQDGGLKLTLCLRATNGTRKAVSRVKI